MTYEEIMFIKMTKILMDLVQSSAHDKMVERLNHHEIFLADACKHTMEIEAKGRKIGK